MNVIARSAVTKQSKRYLLSMQIRQLKRDDAVKYKSIRLEMLQANPEAFGGSYEESKELDLNFFEDYIENNYVIGAFDENEMIGSLGGYIKRNKKLKHCLIIFGVFVKEAHRGKGITDQMTQALITTLPGSVEQIKLTVTSSNEAALRTYKKLGFEEYGYEKRALKIDNNYFDEIHMIKFLD